MTSAGGLKAGLGSDLWLAITQAAPAFPHPFDAGIDQERG